MDKLAKTTIWMNRILITLVSVLFTIIGIRNMIYPAESAAASGITLNSSTAYSVARVSMGAFPFAFALFTFTSLLSNNQLFRGVLGIFIMIMVVTVVRLIGFAVDGVAPFIGPEIVITVFSAVGLYLESRRKKKYHDHGILSVE